MIANNRKIVLETRANAMKFRADGMPTEVVETIETKYNPAMSVYQKSQRDFAAMQEQAFTNSRLHYAQSAKTISNIAIVTIFLLIVGILLGASWLIRSIRRPLVQANDLASRIAPVLGAICISLHPELANRFGIRGIPTMIFFKNGQAAKTLVGVQAKDEIKKSLEEMA